ncbi:MAG: hypothetical protein CL484_10065 [Acidobacteria bacterium]|nr:hypothetical protein [Acidobacteriota bacterium]
MTVTLTEAKRCASAHGYTIKKDEYGEYAVAKRGNTDEGLVYYTDDLTDAVITMRYLSGFRDDPVSVPGRAWRKMHSEIRDAALASALVGRWASGYVDPIRTEEDAS